MPTPYTGMVLPVVSATPGPQWATLISAALTVLDAHSHSPGSGVPIGAAGLRIDADVPFNGMNATVIRSARFQNLASPPALATDVACLAVAGGDLYYVNAGGQAVKLTAGASLNASSLATIGGDYSTSGASEVYIAATQLFQFFQAANKYASLDAGSVTIRQPGVASPNGITLQSPSGLSSGYAMTLPSALPGSTQPLSVSSTGVLSSGQVVTAQIADANVTTAKIADLNVTTAKLADASVTKGKMQAAISNSTAAGSLNTSSTSYVDVANLAATITTTGRPVMVVLQSAGSAASLTTFGNSSGYLQIIRDGSVAWEYFMAFNTPAWYYLPAITIIDTGAPAGSHTWKVQLKVGAGTVQLANAQLVAVEL